MRTVIIVTNIINLISILKYFMITIKLRTRNFTQSSVLNFF